MLLVLIEKEIRDLMGSTKFAITFGACAALIILTFYIGATRHQLYQTHYEASLAENTRALEGLTDWSELDDTRVFLPPQPLASLVSGVANDIDRTAIIRGRGDIPVEDSRYGEDPVYAIFRFIDLEFIFKVILALFAILLGYDAICGEKERGTLRLNFANALPRHAFILGKLIGSFLALTASLSIAIALGALILPLLGITLTVEEWVKLVLISLAGLLYFGAFLALSIFVSAITHRSANSFLILLVIWVMCIHIIPGISVLLAARSVDVPTSDEIAYKKSSLATQLRDEFDNALGNFTFEDKAENPDEIMGNLNSYIDSLNEAQDVKIQGLSARLQEDRNNRQAVQEKLAFSLARISPATSLSLATSHLSGTSLRLKDKFALETEAYQKSFGNFMKEKTGMNTGGFIKLRKSTACNSGQADDTGEKPKPINPQDLPLAKMNMFGLSESIELALVDIGLLLLYNFLFFAGAFIAFLRYDLR